MDSATLIAPIVVCAAAGLLCCLFNRRLRLLSGLLALAAGTYALVQAFLVFRAVSTDPLHAPVLFRATFDALNLGSFTPALFLHAGPFSALLFLAIAFFAVIVFLYALHALRTHEHPGRLYSLLLWALAGALTVVLADNWLPFLIGWALASVVVYLFASTGADSKDTRLRVFFTLGFADVCILLAVVLLSLYPPEGHTISPLSQLRAVPMSGFLVHAVYVLLLIGALAKAGAIPLHKWVPVSASHAHPVELALLTAAIDKFLGIYLLALISLRMFDVSLALRLVLLIIGAVTVLGAVFMAMVQHNLKKLLAYHAVSQVGYLILGLGTGAFIGILGGLFHMINNALYKACLFLGAGAAEDATGETDLAHMGGLAKVMPGVFLSMLVAALAISGIPPLNGFASKWMIYQGAIASPLPLAPFLLVVLVFGSALTLASFIKVISAMFFGRKPDQMHLKPPSSGRVLFAFPMLILALFCILFGVWYMFPVDHLVAPAVAELSGLSSTPEPTAWPGLWTSGWATLLILVGIALGILLYLGTGAFRTRTVPAFMAGEIVRDDRSRFRASNFYRTVEELPLIGALMKGAQAGTFDLIPDDQETGCPACGFLARLQDRVVPCCVTVLLFVLLIALFALSIGALCAGKA